PAQDQARGRGDRRPGRARHRSHPQGCVHRQDRRRQGLRLRPGTRGAHPHRGARRGRAVTRAGGKAVRVAVLACALGSGVSGAVGSEGELPYGEFSTRVVISVGGQPTMIGPFTGLDEAVATAVRVQLERQEFVAATRDGAAVDSDAFVEGRIVLVPAGTEDYDVQLRDVRLKPARAVSTPKPRYPSREFQRKAAGHVELELLVDADGNVAGATTISAATPGFEKAAREAALAWTFQTTGRPVRMAVP